jgi:exopolysaccharide production protein ExoQ
VFELRLAEKGFVILSYLFLTGAVLPVVNIINGRPPDDDPITKVLTFGILLGIIFLIFGWHKKVIRIVIKEKLLWVLLGIALFSVFWSANPEQSITRVIALLRATLFGVYLAARFSLKEQLRLLAWALGIVALLSLVFAVALPSYGVMGMGGIVDGQEIAHAGTWRGVYTHKNVLGRIMVVSVLVFFLVANSSRRYRWVTWGCFCLSIGLIVLSTSKTSLLIVLVILALLPIYQALRWNNKILLPFLIAVIFVAAGGGMFLIDNIETILGATGRDANLTGRVPLWSLVISKIWERPWLGYGYGGFWSGGSGEDSEIWQIMIWGPPHSHNGFLEIWLALGLLGFLVFVLNFIAVWFRAVAWVRLTKTAEGLWPISLLTFLFLANLTENSFLDNQSVWVLYVSITLSMHNKSENFVESKAFFQNKAKGRAMKHGANDISGKPQI